VSAQDGRRERGCGCAGCVFTLLAAGVGLVLLGLGLMPATTEALPFGAIALLLGLCAAVPSAVALFRGWAAKPAEPSAAPGYASGPARPPASIACPSCGGAAPLGLAEPTHSSCPFCRSRFALPPEISRLLSEGAAAVGRQSAAERQLAATVASLAEHERSWKLRLAVVVGLLFFVSAIVGVIGFAIRELSDSWHGYFAFGSAASTSTLVLGLIAALIVPPAVRRVVGSWTAIRLPGQTGLGCRVCGGPLPATVAPVLRCSYCSADNLASAEVMRKLSASARQSEQGVLAVSARKARGDELAASTLRAFPLIVALVWFAVGAASGSVVFAIARELHVWPSSSERFSLVRTGPGEVCLAATEIEGERVELYLSAGERRTISRADLARYSAADPIGPSALEGRQTTRGRIASVYRPLNHLGMHRGRLADGTEIYFPNVLGAGQQICLTDVPAGTGPVLGDG
jgi:hypothetical protein